MKKNNLPVMMQDILEAVSNLNTAIGPPPPEMMMEWKEDQDGNRFQVPMVRNIASKDGSNEPHCFLYDPRAFELQFPLFPLKEE